jgi:hypothetical protein
MSYGSRPLDQRAFERLAEQLAVATVRCSDEQVLELADGLHASLRRRRGAKSGQRPDAEQRSWMA